jgi:ABC-type transport system involved in multi-copper enzyme maturation permease subunit
VIDQFRSELLKIRSTRTTLGLLLTMIALVLLFTLLGGLLTKADGLDEASEQRDQLGIGGIATIFAALAGMLMVTSEYRFGTIRPTFVFTPQRLRVVCAKLFASTVAGLALAAVAIGLTVGIGLAILSARGISLELDTGDVLLIVFGGFGAAALWGAAGAGLGAILHNQVASIIALLVWVFVLENVLFGLVPSVGRFGPGHAGDALAGMTGDHLLPAWAGGGILLAWAAGLGAAGLVLTARRDVS